MGSRKLRKKVRIDIVMRGDRLPVGVDLAEEQRLEEAPGVGQQMKVLHRPAELKGAQHVALDVDVAGEIGIADAAFIEAGDGLERPVVLRASRGSSRHRDRNAARCRWAAPLEGYGGIGELRREAAEQAAGGGRFARTAACRGLREFQIIYHGASRAGLACGVRSKPSRAFPSRFFSSAGRLNLGRILYHRLPPIRHGIEAFGRCRKGRHRDGSSIAEPAVPIPGGGSNR